ncbi:hypothetical protein EDB81DRAFT_944653 [Dactylonectria macrodidyma]|uniref:Extracellular membrane protein CFEM domain-containing protein n=1 Tax=Dactylonectria macrodidyma TaxID=307937 RepID=A0A9P9F8N3_9HYPO|nr:hypothetical protein EDB81DRAFT_944653 [Dactylonectria macrodidyma]
MRLISFLAVLLSIATAGAASTNITQLLDDLPTCLGRCYSSAVGDSSEGSTVADFCNEEGFWARSQDCILQDCSVLDRLWTNDVQSRLCDEPTQTREKRFYYLLVAEVPAWISPWLRLFSSWRSSEGIRVDDYVMSGCWVLYTVYITCVHIVHHNVFDVDIDLVGKQGVVTGLKILFYADKLALICNCLAKVAIIYFYLKTFSGTRFRVATSSILILTLIPTLVFVFVLTFQCAPVSFSWDGWSVDSEERRCLDIRLLSLLKLGFDIGQSIVLLALPLPFLQQVSMSMRVKLGAAVMYALGGLSVGMSGLRLRCVIEQKATTDQPWEFDDRLIWTGIEVAVLITLACAPSIWKLLVPARPTTVATLTGRRNPRGSLKKKPPPPIQTKLKSNTSVSRKPLRGPYSTAKGGATESELELDLQLGDKARGDVWTQIKGGKRFSGFSMISHVGDRLGIRVKTTTTTRVEVDESDGDEGSIVTPRRGALSP